MTGPASIDLKGCLTITFALFVLGFAAVNSFSTGFAAPRAHVAFASEVIGPPLVDRAHKGDRLDGPAPVARGIMDGRPTPRLIEGCEPVASPYVDPALARIPGHCFG
jgi:hypothetical protein